MHQRITRRSFLQQTALATAAGCFTTACAATSNRSPNDKLNIGVIGVANQGNYNLNNVSSENIVALCDIDEQLLSAAAKKLPKAKTYRDFRRLIDQNDLDAIVISTPDHTHAVAAVAALQSGRHLYCEKPLARTISETRIITETARKQKCVTQLGTQIHAGSNYRRVVELIQSNSIGPVTEVHVWVAASYGNIAVPTEFPPPPAHIHYDLWLGPIQPQPYHPDYLPFKWRHWWAFAGGALADFGCHFMDLPHWALELKHPSAVEIVDGPPVHPQTAPPWLIARYVYPARGPKPAVKLTWHHGGKRPDLLTAEQYDKWKSGVLFIGENGMLLADYGRHLLLPEKKFENFQRPARFIKDSIGHHKEWIEACKHGAPTTCDFSYSGPLTEAALLGNVAFRTGQSFRWDPVHLKAVNCPQADEFIQHHYRAGWKI